MALTALARRLLQNGRRGVRVALILGIIGAALFYGDSVITPAISVLSAVEGFRVAAPGLSHLVLPIAITILTLLFAVQRHGTKRVGALFGPVMFVWFVTIAVAGVHEIVKQPSTMRSLSPTYAVAFVFAHPVLTFIAMGAIVLAITGAEALYADMGHFGRPPIRRAWFFVVFPALILNYLGQGALLLRQPSGRANPFFLLLPHWAQVPMVVLATAATVIASQAVISGAFSVSRQAGQLGLLPPLRVRQTSEHEAGQIYLPLVNAALFLGVLALTLGFRSSERLATAYGVAVTGALLVDTILLIVVARALWHWPVWRLALLAVGFGAVELTFFTANLTKVVHGGWLPLFIALLVFTTMSTWQRGRIVATERRKEQEGPLQDFVESLRENPVQRVPGTAVFPHAGKATTPLALRANVEHNKVLHEHVVIVSAVAENVPHVPPDRRLTVDNLGYDDDGIVHLTLSYGFSDTPDIPEALREACKKGGEVDLDPDQASYFLSRATIERGAGKEMASWRKLVFITLTHNAASPADYFNLPGERTVMMGTRIAL
jgi:KUP system potassium uptake protein